MGGSLLMRLALPVLGLLLGGSIEPPQDNGPLGGDAGPGFLLGAALAMVIDWTALSWKPAEAPRAGHDWRDSLWLAPGIDRDGRWGLSLGARW